MISTNILISNNWRTCPHIRKVRQEFVFRMRRGRRCSARHCSPHIHRSMRAENSRRDGEVNAGPSLSTTQTIRAASLHGIRA